MEQMFVPYTSYTIIWVASELPFIASIASMMARKALYVLGIGPGWLIAPFASLLFGLYGQSWFSGFFGIVFDPYDIERLRCLR